MSNDSSITDIDSLAMESATGGMIPISGVGRGSDELATISVHDLNSATGAGGYFDALMMQRQQHAQKPTPASTPKGPSELGNICRDAYTGTGAVIGGAVTSETAGWGAIPGTIIGGALGRALCPP